MVKMPLPEVWFKSENISKKDNLQMVREVDGGSSHASQNTSIVHFGLGENTKIDSLSITWPGGKTQSLVDIAANQLLKLDEIDEIIEYSHFGIAF